MSSLHGFPKLESGSRETLRAEWLSRRRIPEDFDRLWELYWDDLGPLAPVPESVHDLEEVLVR
jgi:hypothetical protein